MMKLSSILNAILLTAAGTNNITHGFFQTTTVTHNRFQSSFHTISKNAASSPPLSFLSSSSSRLAVVPEDTDTTQVETTTIEDYTTKTVEEWQSILSPEQFRVLREEGTEPPNTSILNQVNEAGTFTCAGCNSPLFTTKTKFESGSGWPSFYGPIDSTVVKLGTDMSMIIPRTEVSCQVCGGHLGHVFDDGPNPTGQRFCMNGVAMNFSSDEDTPDLATRVQGMEKGDPYKPEVGSVLPSVLLNGVLGGLFFNSFLVNALGANGINSPLDVIPLGIGLFYGVKAVNSCRRLIS